MVTTNTILGKTATLAMLPALTLGIFAIPASADYTKVDVSNMNAGFTMTDVTSSSNSGGNTITSSARSVGGNSGSSRNVAAEAIATTNNSARVTDAEAESKGGDASADVATFTAGDATADSSATSATGNGGSAGRAESVNTIVSGDARSDVLVSGGTDKNEVDIDLTDDCACDRANEYHEQSMHFLDMEASSEYDNYYSEMNAWDKEESRHGHRGGWEAEHSYSEGEISEEGSSDFGLTDESAWEVHTKTYVPVKTVVEVSNVNTTMDATRVQSDSDSGNNEIVSKSKSVGGTSGESEGVYAGSSAHTNNTAEVADVEAEAKGMLGHEQRYDRGHGHQQSGDAELDVIAEVAGDVLATSDTSSETGDAGDADDATTDNMILSGRSDSIVTIVKASRHNVVRIVR